MNIDLNRMLFYIVPINETLESIQVLLKNHPEVKFVSLTGVDLGGHFTDEKIPMSLFLKDMKSILENGVQTDGSSVALPYIANIANARVDILPDQQVKWYVEYNFNNLDFETKLPIGTLRIPSFLRHNNDRFVGSRIYLKNSLDLFENRLKDLLKKYPYANAYIHGFEAEEEIESFSLTSATELEFWVKTPDDQADRDQLSTSQELKEQYWKRTIGPVNTALEQTLEVLEKYGFEVEMGHKEVGGVRAKMGNSGRYDHIMEQLEIDWKYDYPMQAADNEGQVKHIVRDIFRMNSLEVTFLAKPIPGVAGSGEHTHLGVAALLKSGKRINLFASKNPEAEFMSPVGFGALMGILKNYELLNPFVAQTHDAFRRLKPGYEAPVCIVTSLGKDCLTPSRNRTVLIGLIRDPNQPFATRFELRSPNPHSNTYLVIGSAFRLMLDGIQAVLSQEKTPKELEVSLSKSTGQTDFYLETNREYRSEKNVFEAYSNEERSQLFGKAPATVWENFKSFDTKDVSKLTFGDSTTGDIIRSYRLQMTSKWVYEFKDRVLVDALEEVRKACVLHDVSQANSLDEANWQVVQQIREKLAKDDLGHPCLLTQTREALEQENYELASDLELEIEKTLEILRNSYSKYQRNLL